MFKLCGLVRQAVRRCLQLIPLLLLLRNSSFTYLNRAKYVLLLLHTRVNYPYNIHPHTFSLVDFSYRKRESGERMSKGKEQKFFTHTHTHKALVNFHMSKTHVLFQINYTRSLNKWSQKNILSRIANAAPPALYRCQWLGGKEFLLSVCCAAFSRAFHLNRRRTSRAANMWALHKSKRTICENNSHTRRWTKY